MHVVLQNGGVRQNGGKRVCRLVCLETVDIRWISIPKNKKQQVEFWGKGKITLLCRDFLVHRVKRSATHGAHQALTSNFIYIKNSVVYLDPVDP
jgi:hypothetical protein